MVQVCEMISIKFNHDYNINIKLSFTCHKVLDAGLLLSFKI